MSRGFVKEGDQEETPIIPPRAALPKGATNYVTPTGLQLLLDERKQLEDERETTHNSKGTEFDSSLGSALLKLDLSNTTF